MALAVYDLDDCASDRHALYMNVQNGQEDADAGDRLGAEVEFTTDDEKPRTMPVGQQGVVEEIDEEGNVCISFCGVEEPQWVTKDQLYKFAKIELCAVDRPCAEEAFRTAAGV